MSIAAWAELSDLPVDRPPLPGGDEEWNGYLLAASETLYGLTGRRFPGVRERAIELYAPPCEPHGRPGQVGGYGGYSRYGGYSGFGGYGGLGGLDGFGGRGRVIRAVRLPNRPVVELLAVRTHTGDALPLDHYRIARGGYLESAPDVRAHLPTDRHPIRLRYRFGVPVSAAGRVHAAALALALGQSRLDPDSSPLPGTVTQIVRQGVTFTQQAASTLIDKGMTGLAPVDSWVSSVNPTRSTRRPRSWSPDTEARHYPLDLTEVPLP